MKTIEEVQGMKIEDLRKYAQELGIKNVKKYPKNELIEKIASMIETPETDQEEFEMDMQLSKRKEFYDFVKKYDVTIEKHEVQAELRFKDEEVFKVATAEFKKQRGYGSHYCNREDSTLSIFITLRTQETDVPRGDQSLQIYHMLMEHPTWSHYKIRALIGCTYTNIRRVWLKYVKDKVKDQRPVENYKKSKKGGKK